jgi:hypothetical protein
MSKPPRASFCPVDRLEDGRSEETISETDRSVPSPAAERAMPNPLPAGDDPDAASHGAWRQRTAALLDEMKKELGDSAARAIWQQVLRMTGKARGRPKGANNRNRSAWFGHAPTDADFLDAFDKLKAEDRSLSDWKAALIVVHHLAAGEGALRESIARRIIRHHKLRQQCMVGLDK